MYSQTVHLREECTRCSLGGRTICGGARHVEPSNAFETAE